MRKLLHHCSYSNRRKASAIIGALVVAGILAMAAGLMISSSNTAIRQSADRITYEEAYQAALAGTHVARAWLIDPALAGEMAGNNPGAIASELGDLVNKASSMNQKIMEDVSKNNFTDLYGSKRYADAGFNLGATVSGNRRVIYTFASSPVVTINANPKAGEDLFNGTPDDGAKTYVEWMRLTTPGTDGETSASLREATFFVEALGVSEYGGKRKERVVQQRILIKPNQPAAPPLLSALESILTSSHFSTKAMSSGNVHWGPVLAKGNIENGFFNPIQQKKQGNNVTGWEFTLNQSQKANIAGLKTNDSGNNGSINELDTRLRWMTGKNGKLYAGQHANTYMFENISNVPAGEFDFFANLIGNKFTDSLLTKSNFSLDSAFASAGTTLDNPNGLYNQLPDGKIEGALVQGSDSVDKRIDSFFDNMSYEELKSYAQSHNGYYTWDGSNLRDASKTVIDKIPSMVPGNQDTLAADASPDKILFIDSVDGSETKPFTKAIQLPTFWKGVVYANGPIYTSGAGSAPDIKVRSPEQFAQYRATGSSGTNIAKGVFVDGIVICNGTADLGANGVIYGTLAAKGGVITGANFSVFYNSANGEGRLKDTSTGAQAFNLIAGRLYETKVPNS